MEPSEMSVLTFFHADFRPLRTTLCFPSLKKSDKMTSRLRYIPFCGSLNNIPLFHTLSKAFKISSNTLLSSNSLSSD